MEEFRRRYGMSAEAAASLPPPAPPAAASSSGGGGGGCAAAGEPACARAELRVGRRSVYMTEAAAAALEAMRRGRLDGAARLLQRAWRRRGRRLRRDAPALAASAAPAVTSPSPPSPPPPRGAKRRAYRIVYRGDRIVSRRPLAKVPIHFHTRKTCLPFSHTVPFCELPQGLVDALS
ncbi:hypothetical protein R5R35_002402 [Gryllus longicercus]|uniref:Uncharacterized protein n=1 Tax=Gryllus longicercus TaxID=2509291 RepID=A0AAN9WGB7_9ORTH